jgi:glycosyltransferase involved in cell wall biosynthesis
MYPTESNPAYGAFIKSQIDSIASAGVDVDLLFINGRTSRWNYARAVRRLREKLRERQYDLVHAHYGLSGMVACAQRELPVVVSFCGDDLLGTSNGKGGTTLTSRAIVWLDQLVARTAQGVIIKSRKMLDGLRSTSLREKAVVIPNGVDFELFRPMDRSEARRRIGLREDRRYILFPSTPVEPVKRIDLAKAAVRLLTNDFPDAELVVLFGEPQEAVPLYMNACDAMVLTSDSEGSPNVIKEAMACNLPVVSVDAGDAWDVIGGAKHCYFAARDPEDIAARLTQVFDTGERSDGRERIQHLEIGAVARRVIEVYEQVVKR